MSALAFGLPIVARSVPPANPPSSDDDFIRRCVQLAARAAGQTRPNPPVGCVIVDPAGRPLGEGYHRRAGAPHAEVNALNAVRRNGATTRGATVYVSLEPCNHYGRTPPCSKALVDAGVSRVVVGMVDPDPRTSGGGIATLRDNGVSVTVGVQQSLCERVAEGFVSRVLRKRPMGTLKWAMTLDGKIASETGSSQWVTGPDARSRVHQLRATMDAIIVGGATVRHDNPRLTVRGVPTDGDLTPIRVVMTRTLDLPHDSALWDVSDADTMVFTESVAGHEPLVHKLSERGVEVVHQPGLTPDHVMQHLYERGCLNVLWECGGALAAQAIAAGAVQKAYAFIAPKIIGGQSAPTPIGSPPVDLFMSNALELHDRSVETFTNGDLLVTGYLPQHT